MSDDWPIEPLPLLSPCPTCGATEVTSFYVDGGTTFNLGEIEVEHLPDGEHRYVAPLAGIASTRK